MCTRKTHHLCEFSTSPVASCAISINAIIFGFAKSLPKKSVGFSTIFREHSGKIERVQRKRRWQMAFFPLFSNKTYFYRSLKTIAKQLCGGSLLTDSTTAKQKQKPRQKQIRSCCTMQANQIMKCTQQCQTKAKNFLPVTNREH